MSCKQKEGLILLLDVGFTNTPKPHLPSFVDIIQTIIKEKISSEDELALILYGSLLTDNELCDKNDEYYRNVQVVRPLSKPDWKLLDYLQNEVKATSIHSNIIEALLVATNHFHEQLIQKKEYKLKRIMILTDFSSSFDGIELFMTTLKGLNYHDIRVDVITLFSNLNIETLSNEQQKVYAILKKASNETKGIIYSFGEGKPYLIKIYSFIIKINFLIFRFGLIEYAKKILKYYRIIFFN